MYFYHQHVCNFTFTELISEDSGTDWMEILKTALKKTEKYVLPLAIFKEHKNSDVHTSISSFVPGVSHCCLMPNENQLYHGENKLHSMR
jgi:hypothetical protein